jgi:hypothetical protein
MGPHSHLSQPVRQAVRSAWRRWLFAIARICLIALGAAALARVPFPLLDDWLPIKNVVIAIAAVGLIGKTLFDTLFYDHYWP